MPLGQQPVHQSPDGSDDGLTRRTVSESVDEQFFGLHLQIQEQILELTC